MALEIVASWTVAAWGQTPNGTEAAAGVPGGTRHAVDAFVAAEMSRRALPGVAVAITRGGAALRVEGYGRDSDGRPVTPETRFYIGSNSKAFTALAVMQLVDQAQVVLDAPVRRYLPAFRLRDPRFDAITVRQLLNHTSGMWELGFRQWALPQPTSLEAAVARLAPVRLASAPGTAHEYFNPNYAVAARLVEVVSGRTFADYLREHVFEPLEMRRTTTVDFIDEARDGAARGHVYAFGRPIPAPGGPFFVNGAGGIVSTASDMAKWVAAQANGARSAAGVPLVSRAGFRVLLTPSPEARGYAFGWNVAANGRISHSGGLPTYSSYVAFFEGGDGVVVLAPTPDSNVPREIALGILALHQGRSAPAVPDPLMPKLDLAAGVLLAGNWAFTTIVLARTRRWAAKRPTVRRIALGLTPYAVTAAAVLLALPALMGQVVPWSWLWLGYYYPVWTALLLSLAVTSVIIIAVRTLVLVHSRKSPTQWRSSPSVSD